MLSAAIPAYVIMPVIVLSFESIVEIANFRALVDGASASTRAGAHERRLISRMDTNVACGRVLDESCVLRLRTKNETLGGVSDRRSAVADADFALSRDRLWRAIGNRGLRPLLQRLFVQKRVTVGISQLAAASRGNRFP